MGMDRKSCFDCKIGERIYPTEPDGPKRLCLKCSVDLELIPFRAKLKSIIEKGESDVGRSVLGKS